MSEKSFLIKYNDSQITMFSDEKNDYVNLTEIATAYGKRKSIKDWLKTRQTLDFLCAWGNKHNKKFTGMQMLPSILNKIKSNRFISIQDWIETTNAIGIFSRVRGADPGTWAHKDIAIRFAGWLNPEFELYLVEEIQKLKELERKVETFELLNSDQILALVRIKEVFKYVAHQVAVEDAHKDVYAARSGNRTNPFAEFNAWRNKILDIEKGVIDTRIKQYCIEHKIPMHTANKLLKQSKREQILKMDSYESVKIAVWDFLTITGEVNALHLANLVEEMVKIENAQIVRENKTDLLHVEQDLGEFNNFINQLDQMPQIKTARQVLEYRKDRLGQKKQLGNFDKSLKGLLAVTPPPKRKKKE